MRGCLCSRRRKCGNLHSEGKEDKSLRRIKVLESEDYSSSEKGEPASAYTPNESLITETIEESIVPYRTYRQSPENIQSYTLMLGGSDDPLNVSENADSRGIWQSEYVPSRSEQNGCTPGTFVPNELFSSPNNISEEPKSLSPSLSLLVELLYIDENSVPPEEQYNDATHVPFFNSCSALLGYTAARSLRYRLHGIMSIPI